LGADAKIKKSRITDIIEQTQNALSNWERLAETYGVSPINISLIKSHIEKHKA